MKILQCIHSINCGGTQRRLSYLTYGLVKKGYRLHIAYLNGSFFAQKLINDGAILYQIKNIGGIIPQVPKRYFFFDPIILLQLDRLIDQVKPDIIQTWYRDMDIPAGLIAIRKKIPWILCETNSCRTWSNNLPDLIRKYIGKNAQAIVSNSRSGDKYWEYTNFKGRRYIIRNALPYRQIRSANSVSQNLEFNPNENFILYAGRFTKRDKNIHNLFEAIVKNITHTNLKAILCGDGPYKLQIAKKAVEYGIIENVILPGFITDQFLWTLMKKAKLLISASNFEGCPNVVLEAMACGCPLVVSDIPEHREFLDESTAWFVDPNSPDDIASGIQKVLDNPKEARKKALLAQQKARNWQSIAKMAKDYEKVYYAVLSNKL